MAAPIDDFRSDTVTRPTPGMREAIARAEVGDDALGDDPTVQRLEARIAELLGKEASLFLPSGTMANQTAVHVLSRPGTEAVLEGTAHILDWEEGAAAAWSHVQLRAVDTDDGLLTAERVAAAVRPPSEYRMSTSLICVENTHNASGGRVLPLAELQRIRSLARARGIPVHLDGARLWNAGVAAGVPVRDFAAQADTVMVTLSKGLGCPVGSMLAGSAEVVARARRVRRRLGGGMRQAGILAAAGLYALDHHLERLGEDHERARRLAEGIAGVSGARVVPPETNIVMIHLERPGLEAAGVIAHCEEAGVLVSEFAPGQLRMVTHLDVDDDAVARAIPVVRRALEA